MGSAQKIAAAATATEQVQEEVLKAFNALTGFASHINAYGVFTDCFHPRGPRRRPGGDREGGADHAGDRVAGAGGICGVRSCAAGRSWNPQELDRLPAAKTELEHRQHETLSGIPHHHDGRDRCHSAGGADDPRYVLHPSSGHRGGSRRGCAAHRTDHLRSLRSGLELLCTGRASSTCLGQHL